MCNIMGKPMEEAKLGLLMGCEDNGRGSIPLNGFGAIDNQLDLITQLYGSG